MRQSAGPADSGSSDVKNHAVFRPERSQALLGRFRAWIDNHTDQGIIVGSLLIGFWLIGNSIYLIVSSGASWVAARERATHEASGT